MDVPQNSHRFKVVKTLTGSKFLKMIGLWWCSIRQGIHPLISSVDEYVMGKQGLLEVGYWQCNLESSILLLSSSLLSLFPGP